MISFMFGAITGVVIGIIIMGLAIIQKNDK